MMRYVWAALLLALVAVTAPSAPLLAQGATEPPAVAEPPKSSPAPSEPQKPAAPGETFGEEVQITAKTIVYMKGTATWDSAFETLVDSFKSVYGLLEKQGIKPSGPVMTIYLEADDTGFQYQAAVPVAQPPADAPKGDIEVGQSPAGRMLKFVHRGSYDGLYTTYDTITEYLDSKQLEAQDTFVEEYVTDPVTTPEDQLVINVLVPLK